MPHHAINFGKKVRFKNQAEIADNLKNKEFCLLGYSESAICLVAWELRGQYNLDYCSANIDDLELLN